MATHGTSSYPPKTLTNYVNGTFAPTTASSPRTLPVTNPFDGSTITSVVLSSAKDLDAAVQAAQKAYEGWSKMNVKTRVLKLMRLHHLMTERLDELADLVVREHGKNVVEAKASITKGMETLEWAIGVPSSPAYTGRFMAVSRGVTCRDERLPLGVVASIVPFNFPVMVPFWTIPIALVTGNTIIVKPSEKVPCTLGLIAQLIKEAGIPDGCFNLVNGDKEVVEAICDHSGIKAVTFVGSTPIAKFVSTRAQANHKRVVALGGAKNHLVAAPDCNISVTAQDIVNSYSGCAGQRCMAASVLLTIGSQDTLVNKIVELSKGIKPGNKSGEMGPVIDKASLDKIERYLAQAEKMGAEILVDGRKWKGMEGTHEGGWWIGPTVIRHKNKDDPAITDEIFGPVLSILAVDTKEEAIAIENASPFGNAAAIYTTSGLVAEWFCEHFSTGMVGVNIGIPVPREPFSFGGIAESRWGTQVDITGEGGIEFFTYRKKVTSRWTESADGFFASSSSSSITSS